MSYAQRSVAVEAAGTAAVDALTIVLLAAEREAKRLCPRDTSNLVNSITHKIDTPHGTRVEGTLGTNVEYAAPVEFGTHSAGEADAPGKVSHAPGGMPPRPFLRPGMTAGIAYARSRGIIK